MKKLPEKLKSSRLLLNILQTEAACVLGKTNSIISYYEDGTRTPSIADLVKLAKLYHRRVEFFLDDTDDYLLTSIRWQTKPSEKIENLIRINIQNQCDNHILLETLLGINTSKSIVAPFDIHSIEDAINLANWFSTTSGLGSRPSHTLQTILEDVYNIKVLKMKLENCLDAITFYRDNFVVILNSDNKQTQNNLSLAYNLFHVLISNQLLKFDELADHFALTLLLPTDEIKNSLKVKKSIFIADIVDIAIEFTVSFDVVLLKLLQLKFLNFEQVQEIRSMNIQESSLENKIIHMNRLERLALKNYIFGNISSGKLCDLVNIDRYEIANYLKNNGVYAIENMKKEYQLVIDHVF